MVCFIEVVVLPRLSSTDRFCVFPPGPSFSSHVSTTCRSKLCQRGSQSFRNCWINSVRCPADEIAEYYHVGNTVNDNWRIGIDFPIVSMACIRQSARHSLCLPYFFRVLSGQSLHKLKHSLLDQTCTVESLNGLFNLVKNVC